MLRFRVHLKMSLSALVSQIVLESLQAELGYVCSCISQAMLGWDHVLLATEAVVLGDLNMHGVQELLTINKV